MKALLKVFVLLALFSVEIRVHADAVSLLTFSEECRTQPFGESLECHALNSSQRTVNHSFENFQVSMEPAAVLSVDKSSDALVIHWTKGQGLVNAKSGLEIRSAFGSARCEGVCLAYVQRTKKGLELTSFQGQWLLLGFEQKNQIQLSKGASVQLGPVDESGESSWGIPFTLSRKRVNSLLKSHGKILSPEEKQHAVGNWKKSVAEVSALYEDRAQRKVATQKAEVLRKKRQKEAFEAESKALRELFRQKSLLD